MAGLKDQPNNMNPLSDLQFKFEIDALPEVTFFVQGCNLPGVSVQAQSLGLPTLPSNQVHSGVREFEQLSVQFLIDEYLKNWISIFNWIVGEPNTTSAVLTLLTSSKNPQLEVHFKNVFPSALSEIVFDSTAAEPTYQVGTVTFTYSEYFFKNLLNEPR